MDSVKVATAVEHIEDRLLGDRLPAAGETVKSELATYKLMRIIGKGAFGIVFESEDGDKHVAIKIEKCSNSMFDVEVNVLRAAARQHADHICELIDCGAQRPDYVFIVITLLGKDLRVLRSEQMGRHFSLSTAVRVGIQTLQAVEQLHRSGYISRDIKPENFAIGRHEQDQHRTIFLFDFGLAKKYINKDGNHFAFREEVGWRGTLRYGLLNAHRRLDLGRRDDLESWIYLLIEITNGSLHGDVSLQMTDRPAVLSAKVLSRTTRRDRFFRSCPRKYETMLKMIDVLKFEEEPNYSEIYKILTEIRKEHKIRMHQRFDWDDDSTSHSITLSTTLSASTRSDGPQYAIKE